MYVNIYTRYMYICSHTYIYLSQNTTKGTFLYNDVYACTDIHVSTEMYIYIHTCM